MTSTPAYGFRISQGAATGPMQTAMQAGDVDAIQKVLKERFPTLQFETLPTEEVEKPAEAAPAAAATTLADAVATPSSETTSSIYNDYMAGLPAVARDLVTTDYKGVRGGRLGRGNYTTESLIPGAQITTPAVETKQPEPAAASTPSAPSFSYTTYNYYDIPEAVKAEATTTAPVVETPKTETPTETTTAAPVRAMTPAWARTEAQEDKTVNKAGAGLVPSTQQRGVYVAPTDVAASKAAAGAAQRIEARQEATGNIGVRAAAGEDKKMGAQAVAALIAAPGNDRKAAQAALKQAEKGNIELTNNARQALQQAAKKK